MELSFQLHDFLTSKASQHGLIDSVNQQAIKRLVTKALRPPRPLSDRHGASWPLSWETNPESLQLSLRTFEQGTETLQNLLRAPPSTRATPEDTPIKSIIMTETGRNDPLNPKNRPNQPAESARAAEKRPMPRLGTIDHTAGRVEEITGIRRNAGNPQYSKTSYQRDCIAVLIVIGKLAKNDPGYDLPFLRASINNTDIGAAQAVYRLLSDAKRRQYQGEVEEHLLSSDSPQFILNQENFQFWISRLRDGPGEPGALDLSPDLIEEFSSRQPSPAPEIPNPSRPPLPVQQPRRSERSRRERNLSDFLHPDRPDYDPYDREVEEGLAKNMNRPLSSVDPLTTTPPRRAGRIPALPRQDARPEPPGNHQRFHEPEPRRPEAEDELAYLRSRVARQDAELRHRASAGPEFVLRENRRLESLSGHHYNRGHDRVPPPNERFRRERYQPASQNEHFHERYQPNRQPRDYDYPDSAGHAPGERKPRVLRPADVMMFDPNKQSAAFFIRRFQHIAELEGNDPVLRVLPMCLEGDALEWHNGLSARVRQEMNGSLAIWEDELLREYRPNRFESLKKAENMKFRFDDATLTISQYLTRKTNNLHDAGVVDEDMIVRYLWQGLDANLALATPMREEGDTIENFNRRVRNNEAAAKRVHDLNKSRTKPGPNLSTPNPARVQRLLGNLAAKGLVQNTEPKVVPVEVRPRRPQELKRALETSNTKGNEQKPKKSPPRPCRHCNGDHWDNDCTDQSRKVMKVDPEEEEEDADENEDLDAYDWETYAALEALAEEELQGEESQDL